MMHRMSPPPPGYLPLPARVAPMVATLADSCRDDERWAYEMKWDGVRAVVHVDGGRPTAWSRNDIDITDTYPELRAMAESMGATQGRAGWRAGGARPGRTAQLRAAPAADARVGRRTHPTPDRVGPGDLLRLRRASPRRPLDHVGALSGSVARCWRILACPAPHGEPHLPGSAAARRCWPQPASNTWKASSPSSWTRPTSPGPIPKLAQDQERAHPGGADRRMAARQGRRADGIGSLLLAIPAADGLRYAGKVGTGFAPPRCRTCSVDWSRWPRAVPRSATTSRGATPATPAG